MTEPSTPVAPRGLFYGLAAYGLWGVFPLYFHVLIAVQPLELLAHRIIWSVPFLLVLVWAARHGPELRRCLRTPRLRLLLLASTALIAVNWFAYIYSVWSRQVMQSSLGYFICPLVSVLLGRLVLGERLRPLQTAAVLLAVAGVANLVIQAGQLPWIALTLAVSFSLYGFVRKLAGVDSIVGLTIETLVLLPLCLGYLAWLEGFDSGVQFTRLGLSTDVLLLLSGIVTAVPLLFFGQAARLLPLTLLGFLQYTSPTIQFLIAVLILGEPFSTPQLVSFSCIWSGLLLFSADSLRVYRQRSALAENLRQQSLVMAASAREETAGTKG